MTRPLVAIVGRPNVGKSTLFNRMIGERKALVFNEPGVTRDRHFGRADAYGRHFDLVDTGGFDPDSDDQMLAAMREQAQMAVHAADVIIFVVDGRVGLTHTDEQVYAVLRSSNQPLLLAANKLDTDRLAPNAFEFHALGVDRVFPVSAEHGTGLGDLVEALHDALPEPKQPEEPEDKDRIRIAIVGRPNAGKSTLVNRLLGQPRLITSDVPGTTRDAIDTNLDLTVGVPVQDAEPDPFVALPELPDDDVDYGEPGDVSSEWDDLAPEADGGGDELDEELEDELDEAFEDSDDAFEGDGDGSETEAAPKKRKLVRHVRKYTLIDTAGIRRRTHIDWAVEKFGVIKAMQSIDRCHVAVLVVDANDGLTDQDARIATRVLETGRGLIIALNKWDSVQKDGKTADQMAKAIREARPSLSFAPILFMSALTGQRTAKLLDIADEVHVSCRRRIGTPALNRWFEQTLRERPPPLYKRRAVRLYYVTQGKARPPTFIFQSNMPPEAFPGSYLRMLENRLRRTFGFAGTPLRFVVRQRISQYADRPPPPKFTKSAK